MWSIGMVFAVSPFEWNLVHLHVHMVSSVDCPSESAEQTNIFSSMQYCEMHPSHPEAVTVASLSETMLAPIVHLS